MKDTLNDTEARVLAELHRNSEGNGHDFGDCDIDLGRAGISKAQVGGYVSSLSRKGYLDIDYAYDPTGGWFVLTEKGLVSGSEMRRADDTYPHRTD
jgi:hypothetical protein